MIQKIAINSHYTPSLKPTVSVLSTSGNLANDADSYGDPIEVIFSNKTLLSFFIIYILMVIIFLYAGG